MSSPPSVAAIVPAAGASLRLGRPKLLIEFDGRPLIARVVAALRDGGASPVLVVAPPDDAPEGPAVARAAFEAGADVIVPEARPAEMRESIELALSELAWSDDPPDAILLAPGDSPGLSPATVSRLVAAWRERPNRIVAPTFEGRRGHPVVIPWHLAEAVAELPPGVGVNALMAEHARDVVEIAFDTDAVLVDLDTPEDLEGLTGSGPAGPPRMVRLFAIARQLAGKPEVEVRLPEPATVADLRRAMAEQHPRLATIIERVRIAVEDEYAEDADPLPAGARLALIPPVSGGGA